ncbi:hypothetical protein BY996DRAFT_3274675 [Phakopsora pachyrhizi]|nr:hypothetical protein BY996DRAFT_3274675 [Phakopsora pachyrhizi]
MTVRSTTVSKLHTQVKNKDLNLQQSISVKSNKSYRNPNVYKNLVKYFELDEFKTNFKFNVFNPDKQIVDLEFLREEQQKLAGYKQNRHNQRERTMIEFTNSSRHSSNHHQADNRDHKGRK